MRIGLAFPLRAFFSVRSQHFPPDDFIRLIRADPTFQHCHWKAATCVEMYNNAQRFHTRPDKHGYHGMGSCNAIDIPKSQLVSRSTPTLRCEVCSTCHCTDILILKERRSLCIISCESDGMVHKSLRSSPSFPQQSKTMIKLEVAGWRCICILLASLVPPMRGFDVRRSFYKAKTPLGLLWTWQSTTSDLAPLM